MLEPSFEQAKPVVITVFGYATTHEGMGEEGLLSSSAGWKVNILAQFLPEEPISNELKIAQYQSYLDNEKHILIAKTLVNTKEFRQREFLSNLSSNYPIQIPKIPYLSMPRSTDFVRNHEARYAVEYFKQLAIVCKDLGFEFRGRNSTKNNSKAPDVVNALLNYGYALLKTYVRRSINSIGLDNSIPFLHDLRKNTGLVYDRMELWRINVDYSVIQTLENLNSKKRNHFLNEDYAAFLTESTIKTLFELTRWNLSLEEIIFNARIFANFILGKKTLSFNLKPIQVRPLFETDQVKGSILSKSYKELGMNKSTLWYQKKRLEQTGTVRIYNNTKHYFASS
jgi:CRISPR-associated protein Cas1